jgi:hypothetical protein
MVERVLLEKQELQILAVAVVVVATLVAAVSQVVQVGQAMHELPTGHKERFYGTTLCFY